MAPSDPQFVSAVLRRALAECLPGARVPCASAIDVFNSPEARQVKEQIVAAGKKLWQRQYVDGNGGNISVRISPEHVICTPTLLSKADLTPDDLSLIDMDNHRLCGERPQTSEVLMHLAIYRAVPQAGAVIHCHPPYATAHAVAHTLPPDGLASEKEIFIGPVALAPYETPGTQAFADTVLPYVQDHNTVLLANHGIVCWADTVDHAEWYIEIIETYCRTVMLAAQLRTPLPEILPEKIAELLATKRSLGLPDARFHDKAGTAREHPQKQARNGDGNGPSRPTIPEAELDALVASLTRTVLEFLDHTHAGQAPTRSGH